MNETPFFADPVKGPHVFANGPASYQGWVERFGNRSHSVADWLKLAILNVLPAIPVAFYFLKGQRASAIPLVCLKAYLCSAAVIAGLGLLNHFWLRGQTDKYERLRTHGRLLKAKLVEVSESNASDLPLRSYTVTYQDPSGVERQLRGSGDVDDRESPAPGRTMWLVYESPNNAYLL